MNPDTWPLGGEMSVIRHMTFGRSPRHCHMFASERNESEDKRARTKKEGKGGREEGRRREEGEEF